MTRASSTASRAKRQAYRPRGGQIRFKATLLKAEIAALSRKERCSEPEIQNRLQAEMVRAGLTSRLDRLLAGGGPSVEALFIIARTLGLPMEHFLEEAA